MTDRVVIVELEPGEDGPRLWGEILLPDMRGKGFHMKVLGQKAYCKIEEIHDDGSKTLVCVLSGKE